MHPRSNLTGMTVVCFLKNITQVLILNTYFMAGKARNCFGSIFGGEESCKVINLNLCRKLSFDVSYSLSDGLEMVV